MKHPRKTITRTTDPRLFTCWNCAHDLPRECFTPSAIRNNGECKTCRKRTNAEYWQRYKKSLLEFDLAAAVAVKAKA